MKSYLTSQYSFFLQVPLSLYPRLQSQMNPFPPDYKIMYVSCTRVSFLLVMLLPPWTSGSAGVMYLLFKKTKVAKVCGLKHLLWIYWKIGIDIFTLLYIK